MTKLEASYLVVLMEELENRFHNDSCNEIYLNNTKENYDLVKKIKGDVEIKSSDDKELIVMDDISLLSYLKNLFMQENNLTQEDLPITK